MMIFAEAGGGDEEAREAPLGVDALVWELAARVPQQPRSADGAFLFAIDHCFGIRGQGTVLTGTVLQVRSSPGVDGSRHSKWGPIPTVTIE
jgi:selenocysteine-specific elongation factor